MCIAIYKPANVNISSEVLYRCWKRNDDGAGFMYAVDGKLKVWKGMLTWRDFYRAYQYVTEGEAKKHSIVIHFRLSTSGKINMANCHPFLVNENLAFVHNGIIHQFDDRKSDFSDSYWFNRKYLKTLDPNFLSISSFVSKLEIWLTWNRIIFMDNTGCVNILNEGAGSWIDGVWYSSGGRNVTTNNNIRRLLK